MGKTMSVEEKKVSWERHANTVLVTLIVALMIWVGSTTQRTAIELAKLSVEVAHIKQKIVEPDGKFREIEKRLSAIEGQLKSLTVIHENNREHTQ